METLTVKLSSEADRALRERAAKEGKSIEDLTGEMLERAVAEGANGMTGARELLEAAGRVRSLGPGLRQRIIPGVSLEQVRRSLADAKAPSLSEIILEQRGPKR
jgi:plasmid stability protein